MPGSSAAPRNDGRAALRNDGRVAQHKQKLLEGFTKRYNVTELVHFEELDGPRSAIVREKQIKGWSRAKKVALLESANPS